MLAGIREIMILAMSLTLHRYIGSLNLRKFA